MVYFRLLTTAASRYSSSLRPSIVRYYQQCITAPAACIPLPSFFLHSFSQIYFTPTDPFLISIPCSFTLSVSLRNGSHFTCICMCVCVTYGSRWPIICTGHLSSLCCRLPLGSSRPLVIPLGYFTTFRDSSTLPPLPPPRIGRLKIVCLEVTHTLLLTHTPSGCFIYRFFLFMQLMHVWG